MFTTFLFQKLSHLQQFYKTETEFVQHLISGEVKISIPDLINFQQEYEQTKVELPSRYRHGDYVCILVNNEFIVKKAQVIAIHFFEGKVKYDLSIHMEIEKEFYQTRIYNVDSTFLNPFKS